MCRKLMSSVIIVSLIWLVLLLGLSGRVANAELVAGYSFEGNLEDMSGNGYDGTASGTVAYGTGPIAHGQCLELNGTNYVEIPLGSANPIISDANGFTCMSWVNTDAGGINVVLASGALLEQNDWFYAVPNGTSVHFDLWYVDGWSGGGLTPGQWYHVAIVYNADSSYTIYLDGQEIGTETFWAPIGTADRSSFVVRIGGANNWDYPGEGPLYSGLLDDVWLFNTALTQPEIQDLMNLPPIIEFESAASGAFETVSPAELVVTLSHAEATETYTVDYAVTDGDAEGGGVDYTLGPGTLTFEPCDTTETITIDIVNDGEDEDDETIIVTLSNPTGPDVLLGAITEHTYTIIDPRPYVEFAKTASCGMQDVTPATISVTLSHAFVDTVTVDYAVSGGTATGGGVDYNLPAGTLQFDPCQVTQYINIDIVDDPCEEGPETIELTLSNPTNAKFGDNTQHTFAICEKIYALLKGAFYYRLDSGEDWEDVAKVGAYADVKVRLGELDDKLVFWRGSSYRPYWQTDIGTWYVTEEVQMQGGAGGLRPDEINQFSQVFIIENSPARAVVRWRYAHDVDGDVDFKWGDFVDEYYTLYPDGVCIRTIRVGSDNLEQWLDPNNVIIQDLQLLRGGISDLPSSWQNPAELLLSGASASNYDNEGFDDMQRCYVLKCRKNGTPSTLDFTLDTTGGKSTHNPAIVVKNWGDASVAITVDGQAFTNYYTGHAHHFIGSDLVVWLNKESPNSIDISISPRGGTVPGNRAPQVNAGPYQSIEVTPGTGPYEVDLAGSVDDDGLPNDNLTIIWSKVSGPGSADFDDANNPGTSVSLSTEGTYLLHLSAYDGELSGGDDVIIILDEDPNDENERVPVYPVGPPEPGRFGAYYTCLKYSPEWDELWRVGDHVDVVVQFDEFAHRFVFWRGTSYIPCWATDTGGWYTNEFLERRGDQGGCQGCAEPMSDKQCRHGHVRIIQSNDARVIVHWRYPPVDVDYCHPYVDETGWGDWVDEYYTIYPDAVGVRKAKLYTSAPDDWTEWQEGIVLNQPGTMPEDNLNLEAVSLANMNGESHTYSWEYAPPDYMDDPAGANIQTINLKGTTRPFQVINHNSAEVSAYGGHHPDSHFNWWDHWPVAQERSDGSLASSTHRPSHTSLSHLRWEHYAQDNGIIKSRTKIMLHGMTDESVAELAPLARSWEIPPVLSISSPGFTDGSYDKAQRAYKISRNSEEATTLEFTLQGSSGSPIVNPCFVIENWWGDDSDVWLSIDGQRIDPGPDFRRGIEKDANEVSSLVIWIKKDSTSLINITIAKKISGDFEPDGDVDFVDFAWFAPNWMDTACGLCDGADLTGDGNVDFYDLKKFTDNWLAGK